MLLQEKFVLSNGLEIPKIGLGTWQIKNEDVYDAVISAVKVGYRHIDTAIAYGNEEGVGKAIKDCGVERSNLYITSKIPAEVKSYEGAKKCIEESLSRLDLEYLDLMLIHAPRPWDQLWDPNANQCYKENLEVWKAMEEAHKAGKIKSIGISNFYYVDIKNILDNCEIKPHVNQICIFIGNTPQDAIDYCNDNGILVEAYSPIATGRLLNNKIVEEMANKYNVSIAQLCIKYCLDINTLPLPKSKTPSHILENTKVDFEINKEDLEKLRNLSINVWA